MAIPYIDTPRTEVDGNATFLTHGFRSVMRNDLDELDQMEDSFQSPSKDGPLLKINALRKENFRTPRGSASKSKIPLNKRHIPVPAAGKGEFTPLMNSMMKNRYARPQQDSYPETPAPGSHSQATFSTTPRSDPYSNDGEGSDDTAYQATPLPQITDSGIQSSPLPMLPDPNGNIVGDGQVMTLKEQEKAIDKLDKENFNLKLKVHFLEEQINKSRPEYKEQVHRENVELKTEKVSLQRDVGKYKKQLKTVGQSLATCQRELQEVKEKAKKKYADEGLKKDLEETNARLQELTSVYEETKRIHKEKISILNDKLSEVQHNLSEKDRALNAKDGQIESLQRNVSSSNVADELQEKLSSAHEQIEELRSMLHQAQSDASNTKKAYQTTADNNEMLKQQLAQAQSELSHRAADSQTSNRQLQEKIQALQQDLRASQEENTKYERKLLSQSQGLQNIADLKEEITQLQYDLREKDRAIDAQSKQIEKLRQEIGKNNVASDIQEKLSHAQRQIEELESALRQARSESDELKRASQTASEKVEALRGQLQEAQDKLMKKASGSSHLSRQMEETIKTLQRDLASSQAEAAEYERKVMDMYRKLQDLQEKMQQNERKMEAGKQQLENELTSTSRKYEALRREREDLSRQLRGINGEAHDRTEAENLLQSRYDALLAEFERFKRLKDNRMDEEKAELQRIKTRSEAELNRLRQERISLIESRDAVRGDFEQVRKQAAMQEANLTSRADRLESELKLAKEKRDRELAVAEARAEQLQKRSQELENLLVQPEATAEAPPALSSPGSHLLRRHLDEARQKEMALLKQESELKVSIKELRAQLAELEHENHVLKTRELSATPQKTPSAELQEEVRNLCKQVLDSKKLTKDLRKQKKELEKLKVKEEEREELHELLKSSTLEAEALALKLSERDARVQELRSHLRRVKDEKTALLEQIDEMQDDAEVLEQQYQEMEDELQDNDAKKHKHAKEIRGLGKEIQWLRARFLRERKFREDLAWSKGLMELSERVRATCNETDLHMIAKMGVHIPRAEKQCTARRRFKAAAWAVVAVSRMQKFSADWRQARHVGDGLKRAKQDLARKKEGMRKKKGLSY